MTPDVNVLLAAARPDHTHHRSARAWLSTLDAGGQALLIFPMVAASFIRLVINPRVFPHAATPRDALAFIDDLLAAPAAQMPRVGNEWPTFRTMCLAAEPLKPNDVPDVWLAASVRSAGDHLVTFDTGFRRLLKRSELTILS